MIFIFTLLITVSSIHFADEEIPTDLPGLDRHRFIVTMRDEISFTAASKEAFFAGLNVTFLRDLPLVNGAVVRTESPLSLAALRDHVHTDIVELDAPRYLMHDSPRDKPNFHQSEQVIPWGMHRVNAFDVDEPVFGARVCVIDSGYDLGHEDLFNDPSLVHGSGSDWSKDGCAHGTHVAGTIAAVDNNVGVIGVTQKSPLHIVRVFGDDCSWSYASDVIAAAEECQQHGSDIISMSLGCSFSIPQFCRSVAEETGFEKLSENGILSIAAAGNAGNDWLSYPASYDSVMSVAASEEDDSIASFSQRNTQVEVAAPGVGVESTVPMGSGQLDKCEIEGKEFLTLSIEGSGVGTISSSLVSCGLGKTCPPADGKVCLIQRGEISFLEKAQACQAAGGHGVIIYNNEPGLFSATFGQDLSTIIGVTMSQEDGEEVQKLLNQGEVSVNLASIQSNYGYKSGTSMATPHVSGIAAKIWGLVPNAKAHEVRVALQRSAYIPGKPEGSRDEAYGYGIVDTVKALRVLQELVPDN